MCGTGLASRQPNATNLQPMQCRTLPSRQDHCLLSLSLYDMSIRTAITAIIISLPQLQHSKNPEINTIVDIPARPMLPPCPLRSLLISILGALQPVLNTTSPNAPPLPPTIVRYFLMSERRRTCERQCGSSCEGSSLNPPCPSARNRSTL